MTFLCCSTSLFLWQNSISRRSFITTTKRHSAKKTIKTQINKKKTNYFLTNQQNRKIKLCLKTAIYDRTIILLWLPESQLIESQIACLRIWFIVFKSSWSFTKFSPKRRFRNYKENYTNITFFFNNLFWTEQETQRNQNIFRKSRAWSFDKLLQDYPSNRREITKFDSKISSWKKYHRVWSATWFNFVPFCSTS